MHIVRDNYYKLFLQAAKIVIKKFEMKGERD